MVDMSAIGIVANSLNAAVNITKAMIDLRDWSKVQVKVIELQRAILEAQAGMLAANEERSALIQQVRDLEKEMTDLKAWEAEKQNYKIFTVPNSPILVYAPKDTVEGTEASHYLCPNCYTDNKKSLLQTETRYPVVHMFSCAISAELIFMLQADGNLNIPAVGDANAF
jgi:hypothetical protein